MRIVHICETCVSVLSAALLPGTGSGHELKLGGRLCESDPFCITVGILLFTTVISSLYYYGYSAVSTLRARPTSPRQLPHKHKGTMPDTWPTVTVVCCDEPRSGLDLMKCFLIKYSFSFTFDGKQLIEVNKWFYDCAENTQPSAPAPSPPTASPDPPHYRPQLSLFNSAIHVTWGMRGNLPGAPTGT